MRDRYAYESESMLKRFAKKSKAITYSTALLVSFLITGYVGYGAEAVDPIPTRIELSESLAQEKKDVDRKLCDAKKELSGIELQIEQLLRRGKFWVKSLEPSYQFFFNGIWENTTKNKDKTIKNFSYPEYGLHGEYNEYLDRLAVSGHDKDIVHSGRYLGTLGIMKKNLSFTDFIDFGANITPKNVKERELKVPDVEAKNVAMVEFTPPETPHIHIKAPGTDIPVIEVLATPTTPSVAITEPEKITKLEPIEISKIEEIEIDIPVPATVTPGKVEAPEISEPSAPKGFTPKLILSPDIPQTPEIVVPTIPVFGSRVKSSGNSDYNIIDNPSAPSNGVIHMVGITSGNFRVNRIGEQQHEYSYDNYSGVNAWYTQDAIRPGFDGNEEVKAGKNETWENLSRGKTKSNTSKRGFMLLCGNRSASGMLTNANILYSRKIEPKVDEYLGELVHMDIHGAEPDNTNRAGFVKATESLENKDSIMRQYDDAATFKWPGRTPTRSFTWVNTGNITMEGANVSITNHYDHNRTEENRAFAMNMGTIKIQPLKFADSDDIYDKYLAGFVMSDDGNVTHHIMYNGDTGKFEAYTRLTTIYLSAPKESKRPLTMVNRGDIAMYGESSAGIFISEDSLNILEFASKDFATDADGKVTFGEYKPIKLFGDSSIGLYVSTTEGSTKGIFAVDIGAPEQGNKTFSTGGADKTFGEELTDYNVNPNGKSDLIEGTFGIIANQDIELDNHQIRIYDKTKDSAGVYIGTTGKTVKLGKGKIEFDGGKHNFGVLLDGKGKVESAGDIVITGGKDHTAIVAKGNGTKGEISAKFRKIEVNETEDSVIVSASNGSAITLDKGLKIDLKAGLQDDEDDLHHTAVVFAAGAGTEVKIDGQLPLSIDVSNEPINTEDITPNIVVTGNKIKGTSKDIGFGYMAKHGAKIDAQKSAIKIIDGVSAAIAADENSLVNLKGSYVDYKGRGYALYSDGEGIIDFDDGVLRLSGDATAFDVDLGATVMPIKVGRDARIIVDSDDVVVFNLKRANNLTTVGGIDNYIRGELEEKLGLTTLTLAHLVKSGTAHNYKIAAVDGGAITLGSMDKTGVESSTEPAKRDAFQYYNRFLGQRLKATTEAGSVISAIQTSEQAKNFHNQVVALEMNSSKKATSPEDTQINLVNSTLIADRVDEGEGGVGAFINYGAINIDENSKIFAEMEEGNVKNKHAVGVYAANGSIVNNKGIIEAGGENAIGILGVAFRKEDGESVGAEFGEAQNQGKVTITNENKITLKDANGIAIYGENNNPDSQASDNLVINKGELSVGDSKPGGVSIAMYGDRVTLLQEGNGKIDVGEHGIGFYSKNAVVGKAGDSLGTVKFNSDGGVGIYVTGDGNQAKIAGDKIVIDNTPDKKDIVGVYVDLTENADDYETSVKVEATGKNITAYHSNSSDIKVNTDLKLSEGSRGMTAAEGKKITYDGQMELGEGATGISGVKNPVELAANANLKLQGKNSIGIYSEGNAKTDMHGTITLNKDKTIGIYAKDNTSIELNDGSKVEFGNDGTESIAIYLAGSKLTAKTNDPDNPTTLKFEENPDSKNIFIYMQGINGADGPQGSSLALNRVLEVTPAGTPTGSQRTIGVYMDTEMANNGGFVGNTLSGRAKATNKGIAVYSKNHADSDDVYNTYEKVSITAEGEDTAGIFLDGNILVKGGSLLNVKDKAVGIYGNQGVISIDGTNKITVDNNGTGIYMSNGSHLDGGKLVLENKSPTEKAVGLYYNKGTGTEEINHNTELNIPKGNLMLGMYVDGGIKVNNMSKVDIADGAGNTVAYIVGGSEFTNKSDDITIGGTNMKNAIGIYVGHGKGTNAGTIKITDKIGSATDQSLSVAMAAVNDGSGDSTVINSGSIEVGGETVGIYVDDNSSGENSGKIVAKNEAGTGSKPVAVYVNGQNAEFKNTGELNSDNIVIALEDTEKDIEFGKMKITGTQGVGVYAKNSKVNSDIMPEVDANAHKTIALYAAGNTEINGTVSSAEGTGNIGAYLNDANVTFGNNAKIIAKNGTGTDYGIGIFAANGYSGDLKVDVEQQGAKTMGMFLESGTPGNETKVKYTGTFDIGEGIGVFVPEHTEFIGDTATVKIDGGAGVFVSGGKMSMGTEGMINFEFGSKGGSAIYQDGGEVTVGENIGVKGHGTFLTLKDADADVHSVIPVMAQGTGINAMYEVKSGVTPADHTIKLSPTGGIRLLGDNATGISVAVKGLKGSSKKVTIINDGKIETESGKRTVGILAKGASVTNSGELNIGSEGIGIFATTDATDTGIKVVNKDIKLSGEDAIGILVDKAETTEVVEAGKIEAGGNEHIGIYVKDTHGLGKITVQNYVFESDSNGTGAIFDNAEAKLTASSGDRNSIKIGDTVGKSRGIAIAGINGTGEVDSTDLEIGKNSIGIYSGKSNIKFDGGEIKSTTGESVLVYSDEGEITLSNVTNGLTVGTGGIAVAASEGKVVTGSPMSIKVDGENGIGVFVEGDATNPGEVSSNFEIDVDGGIGIYAKGNVVSYGTLNSLKGDNSKGYIFEDLANAANISHVVKLGENGETGQIGVYAKGTGTGVTINGIDIEGEGNIGVYNTANQSITENGDIVLADNSGNNASVGIYSEVADTTDQRTVTVTGKIDVGVNNAGVYAKNSGVKQNSGADINVKSNGVGVLAENTADYYGKGNVEIGGNLIVGDDNAVGVQGINADIKISGDLSVGNGSSKGIYATEKGDIEIGGNMSVGNNSTGIFKDGEGTVTTQSGTITVGDNSQGIFTKNSQVVNNSDIVIGKGSTGIAATKDITSDGDITVGDAGIGLLVKGDGTTKITTEGAHNIGDNVAIGIYADNTEVEVESGSAMTIGDKDSVGIFSLGKGDVVIGGTTRDIAIGKDSIGIYKSGTGEIAVNNSHMDIDDKGYGIYFVGQSGENSIENTNLNMTLGTESVGIYAKNAKVTHNGDIKVGTTTIGPDGYNDPKANRNSIGIFGENSTIEYKGNMTVDKELSVGIYGFGEDGKESSITLKKGSNLIVRNGAIGIMGGQGMKEIVVEKGATIDVAGKTSGGEKSSIGIATYSGVIKNYGVIKLRDGGIAFNIGGSGGLGLEGEIDNPYGEAIAKYEGNPSTGDIGGVEIDANGKVTINDKVINGGIIDIKGHLAMEGMALDIGNKKPIVKADSITGVAKVLPNFSKGNSVQKYTVADVFRTSPEGMGAFSGDVTSASVSWIAKVSKELGSTATRDITLARIPYPELIVGEKYENLAYGLEELRMDIPSTESSPQFKSMDNIHTHEQFAEAVADIRGDIYSNVQERMQTVENNFDRSYRELLDSFNVTRNVHKFSLINTNGRHKDNTLGVSGYKYDSVGVLYLRDNERYSYGGKFGWSAGLMGTRFKFTDETNEGSKEKVISGKLGLHYQRALVERDENARLKYLGRAELTLNRHRTRRYSRIGQDSYKARATYYSADISLRNRVLYDYDINTQWTVRPYLGLDLSYGRFSNIKERDNEFDLKVKHNDYYLVTPNAGVETKYRIPVAEDKEVVVKADVQVDYDAHKLYTDANKAKLKRTSTGYYKLSEPERDRVRTGVGAEIGIEKPDNYGVALRVEYNDANKSHMTYGVRFNYKF